MGINLKGVFKLFQMNTHLTCFQWCCCCCLRSLWSYLGPFERILRLTAVLSRHRGPVIPTSAICVLQRQAPIGFIGLELRLWPAQRRSPSQAAFDGVFCLPLHRQKVQGTSVLCLIRRTKQTKQLAQGCKQTSQWWETNPWLWVQDLNHKTRPRCPSSFDIE